jgi:hypothetical protein
LHNDLGIHEIVEKRDARLTANAAVRESAHQDAHAVEQGVY